jgi:hypothetical protein
MAVMAATAIRAAIRPYSIAVAPLLLRMMLRMFCMVSLLGSTLDLFFLSVPARRDLGQLVSKYPLDLDDFGMKLS